MSDSATSMDCSPPHSSLSLGFSKNTGMGFHALFQGIIPIKIHTYGLFPFKICFHFSKADLHGCYKSLELCLTLCDPMDCSSLGFPVHGILQARTLEWVACAPPGDLPSSGMEPISHVSCVGRQVLYH